MDQKKIGKFISQCRRNKGWTQGELAEILGVTDKAVSKWETGKSMPDISLFMPICELLGITLNELLLGDSIPEEEWKEKSDQVLMGVIKSWIGQEQEKFAVNSEGKQRILHLEKVWKIYDTGQVTTTAAENISFDIMQGSFVGIMGASGSGKSTLLNMIAMIDRPTGGVIEMNGKDITKMSEEELADFRREALGFVFQEYNLLDTLTVYENIALALTIKKMSKEAIQEKITRIGEKLDITSVMCKYPYEVSGGQRQRCACARAIAVEPRLILADEPTGALDSYSAKKLLETFLLLRKEYGATILMATHDAFSASYCDKILFMRDGKIKEVLDRGEETKQSFFMNILERIGQMEGGSAACI